MTHPLLTRWSGWTGSAADAADELSRLLPEPMTSRNFNYYIECRAISPAKSGAQSGRASYQRRHLLEAMAARRLAADGWRLDKISKILPSYDEEALANLADPQPGTSAANPAVDLVRELQAAPARRLAGSSNPLRSLALSSASDHVSARSPRIAPTLALREGPLQLLVDQADIGALGPNELRAQAGILVEAAITHLFPQSKERK